MPAITPYRSRLARGCIVLALVAAAARPAAAQLAADQEPAHSARAVEPASTAATSGRPSVTPPAPAPAVPGPRRVWWIAGELHLSAFSNLVDQSTINLAFGYAAKTGWRWTERWGVYFQIEQNLWVEMEYDVSVRPGVLNLALGIEHLFFGERVRAALAFGPSILLFETALDDPGTTGIFLDVRPAGLRWPINERFVFTLDPLGFTLVVPALSGIPLVQIQYRATLSFEYDLGL
jgi:hypothetical protein